jgi:APA family basic amino acid/polyamine antiporter
MALLRRPAGRDDPDHRHQRGIIGVSRLTYSMGVHRQFPEILRTVHPKLPHPWVAIVVYSIAAIGMMIPASQIGQRRGRSWATCTPSGPCSRSPVAQLRVIALRIRKPDPDQPFRSR